MRTLALPLTALAAAASTFAAPAAAREVDRQEIAEAFAPAIPQERRIYCRDTRMTTLTDGTQFAACAASRQLQSADKYSLRVYDTRVWLGGR